MILSPAEIAPPTCRTDRFSAYIPNESSSLEQSAIEQSFWRFPLALVSGIGHTTYHRYLRISGFGRVVEYNPCAGVTFQSDCINTSLESGSNGSQIVGYIVQLYRSAYLLSSEVMDKCNTNQLRTADRYASQKAI